MAHPVVDRILSGEVPPHVKLAAAKGALPLPREELLIIWVRLRNDQDGEVRLAAKESLANVEDDEWKMVLPEYSFPEDILDFAVHVLGRKPVLLHAVLHNRKVPDQSLTWLASRAERLAIDLIIGNESRLIETPEIVTELLRNPNLTKTQLRRLFDLSEQFFRDHPAIPAMLQDRYGLTLGVAGGAFEVEEAPAEEQEAADEGPSNGEREEEEFPFPEAALEDFPAEAFLEEELSSEKFKNLYQQILVMSVPAKIELALKGNKEARGLLIRDSNKVVQEAVLDSPKLTDVEIEGFARMRSLSVDIFRKMVGKREWVKKYSVIKALVANPKAPPGLIFPFISRLTDMDLKILGKDKNVREVIRREARKIYTARHTRKAVRYKK